MNPPIDAKHGAELIALTMTLPQRVMGLGDYNMAAGGVWWMICAHPGISPSGLAYKTNYPPRTVSRVLARMIKEDWVYYKLSDGDRRMRRYYLTEEGEKAKAALLLDMRDHLIRILAEAGAPLKIT